MFLVNFNLQQNVGCKQFEMLDDDTPWRPDDKATPGILGGSMISIWPHEQRVTG